MNSIRLEQNGVTRYQFSMSTIVSCYFQGTCGFHGSVLPRSLKLREQWNLCLERVTIRGASVKNFSP